MKLTKQFNAPNISVVSSFFKNSQAVKKIKDYADDLSENLLRKIRISYRLIAAFLLLSLLPVLIIGTISINRSSAAMEENVSRYSIEIAKRLGTQFSSQLKAYSDTLLEVSLSKQISEYNNATIFEDDVIEMLNATSDLENFLLTKAVTSNIEEIGFIPVTGDKEFTSRKIIYKQNKDGIFNKIINSDSKNEWIFMKSSEKDESKPNAAQQFEINMPVLFKSVRNTSTSAVIGIAYLVPKKNSFNSIISGIELDDSGEGEVFVSNNENIAIAASNNEYYGKPIPAEISRKLDSIQASAKNTETLQSGYFRTNINGVDNLVSYSFLGQEGWKLITAVPFANLMKKTEAIGSTVFTLGIVCFVFAFLISYLVTRSVSLPLGRINNAVEALKKGDFTQQLNVKFKDEISVLFLNFNSMITDVRAMINDVKKITKEVVAGSQKIEIHSSQSLSASEQIAEAISEIAAGSSEQALESQKGKENIDDLADKLNLIVESTSSVQETTNKTKNLCESSINVVNYLNSSAQETSNATETIVNQINDLNQDMKQINNIMKVILKIADQTNLLALNATIEAARAGEAGKGFAVVADEVKKLAEQSKNASSSISGIITNILKKTAQVVNAANTATEFIQKQMGAVKQTDDTFKSIVSATEEIVVQLENMNELIKSMDRLKNKAVASMESIAGISQSAAAATEEVNATTEEQIASANQLADLSKDLNELATALEKSAVRFIV